MLSSACVMLSPACVMLLSPGPPRGAGDSVMLSSARVMLSPACVMLLSEDSTGAAGDSAETESDPADVWSCIVSAITVPADDACRPCRAGTGAPSDLAASLMSLQPGASPSSACCTCQASACVPSLRDGGVAHSTDALLAANEC